MIYTALDNFYLTDEELLETPSRRHGVDEETETTLRIFGCELIQEAGILLKCPQAVMATGQTIFQRFFCRKSMREYNVRRMACACLFLATKLEENPRRTREVLMVFDRINKRREGSKSVPLLIPETKDYDQMKERVITYERLLLKTFGFIIHAVHPHKYVNSFVHSLDGGDELQQLAWNILNDSLRTTLCVRFKGHVVAAGAIYLAARRLQVPLPEHPPWWTAFKVSTEQLVEVVLTLHRLYQRPKAQYIEVNPDVLKQQQAASGMGLAKHLTPALDGTDSPAAGLDGIGNMPRRDCAPEPGLPQQQVVAGTTAAPPGGGAAGAAEMLAAAVAAAQQRLQGHALVASTAAAAVEKRPAEPDVLSGLKEEANGATTTGAGYAGGAAADAGAIQSRKRSRTPERSRSQDRGKRKEAGGSPGLSRSRSRSRDRSKSKERDRSRRSRSRERDKQRDAHRSRDAGRRERRSRSRDRTRDRDRRDRDRQGDREKDKDRDRRDRDGKGERAERGRGDRDRDKERDKDKERGARGPAGAPAKDEGRERKDGGLPPPPPLPPRHSDRRR